MISVSYVVEVECDSKSPSLSYSMHHFHIQSPTKLANDMELCTMDRIEFDKWSRAVDDVLQTKNLRAPTDHRNIFHWLAVVALDRLPYQLTQMKLPFGNLPKNKTKQKQNCYKILTSNCKMLDIFSLPYLVSVRQVGSCPIHSDVSLQTIGS